MLAWVFFITVLGVTMAIPMKRQMINLEQLRFPTGTANRPDFAMQNADCEATSGAVGELLGHSPQNRGTDASPNSIVKSHRTPTPVSRPRTTPSDVVCQRPSLWPDGPGEDFGE